VRRGAAGRHVSGRGSSPEQYLPKGITVDTVDGTAMTLRLTDDETEALRQQALRAAPLR
jgi:hypothetical protein